MHIVHCLTHSGYGGAQAVVLLLVESFRRFHPEVRQTVVLPKGGIYVERFKQLGCETVELPLHALIPSTAVRLYRLLSTLGPDVVHSHGKGAGFYSRIIPRNLLRARRFHSYHGFHPPHGLALRLLHDALERFLLRGTDSVIFVSDTESREVADLYALPSGRTTTIVNIVDSRKVADSSRNSLPSEIHEALIQAPDSFVVTMIGRPDYIKNYDLAFASCALVLERSERIVFLFVGADPHNRSYVRLKHAHPRRLFAVPMLSEVAGILKTSHALLLTSRKEGCPLIVLESFCLGKPVIGTNVPGITDLVQDGMNGLLCEQSADAISKAIIRLSEDTRLYEMLRSNAAARADAMGAKSWAERYHSAYLNVN